MGLSPAARDSKFSRHLARLPLPRLKAVRRLASVRPREDQPGPGRSAVPPSEESVGSQALVQFLSKQPQQDTSELNECIQQGLTQCTFIKSMPLSSFKQKCQGAEILEKTCAEHTLSSGDELNPGEREKSIINVETTPTQKSIELDSTPKPEREGKLIKQAAEVKPRPRPGDLIEIFRIGYEHWAIYVEDDYVVHLAPPSEEFEVGSITSVFSNRAVVKYSRLQDVLHGCSWKINNKLDGTYLPLPVDKIIQRTKNMINKMVQYSLIEGNCEHFVNDLRYGVHRSQQVEHALMNGAKAAGAVISAVVDSIRPKPLTA
uniref:phospholipase A and acyltransferase 5 isoform X1 n=1 Tax=Ictidomys tridecemlineatus TaxID=43179 RepID=UPI001A9CBF8F|nr:phospholipase A and acyltransferase 5 isoform X1 [Ictidomys tridecemlineatus]